MNEDALSIQRTGENSESQESPAITLPDLLPTPIPRPGQILFFDGSKKVTPGSGVDPRYSFGSVSLPSARLPSVRHPKQPSLALLRYLSPSNEDYVSLGPSWVGNTQPDQPSSQGGGFTTPGFDTSPGTTLVEPCTIPLVLDTGSGPQLAHPTPVGRFGHLPQLLEASFYLVSQTARAGLSPEDYFTQGQAINLQSFQVPAQQITETRDIPMHVPHIAHNHQFGLNTQRIPTEPRAMRKATHAQESISSRLQNLQGLVQAAAMTSEIPSHSQHVGIYGGQAEMAGNISTEHHHLPATGQQAGAVKSAPPGIPPTTSVQEVLRTSMHELQGHDLAAKEQLQHSPLREQAGQTGFEVEDSPFEVQGEPATTQLEVSPSREQPGFVNTQLRRSPFQGQGEVTTPSVRTPMFLGDSVIVGGQLDKLPFLGPVTAASAMFTPLRSGHLVSSSGDFHASKVQGQAVPTSVNIHNTPVHGQRQISQDQLRNSPFPGQPGTPFAEVHTSPAGNYRETGFRAPYVPPFKKAKSPIIFIDANIHRNRGAQFENCSAPPFPGPAGFAHPSVHTTPVRRGNVSEFGNSQASPFHCQPATAYPNFYASPVHGGQGSGFKHPNNSSFHRQPATNMHNSAMDGHQGTGFGHSYNSPFYGHPATAYPNMHNSAMDGDQGTGFGHPYNSPFHGQPASPSPNFYAHGHPGDELTDPYTLPLQRQRGSSSTNANTHGYPGAAVANSYQMFVQGQQATTSPNRHTPPVHGNLEPGFATLQISPTRGLNPRSPSFHVPPKVKPRHICHQWDVQGKCTSGYHPCPHAHPPKEEHKLQEPKLKGTKPKHYEAGDADLDNVDTKAKGSFTVGLKAECKPYELRARIIGLVSENNMLQKMAKTPREDKKVGHTSVTVADTLKIVTKKIQDMADQFIANPETIRKVQPKIMDFKSILDETQSELNESNFQLQQLEIIDRCGKEICVIIARHRAIEKAERDKA